MKIPRGLAARDLVNALERDGFLLKRTRGSHCIYHHSDDRRVVLTSHKLSEAIPIGTLRSIFASAKWTEDDFQRLEFEREQIPTVHSGSLTPMGSLRSAGHATNFEALRERSGTRRRKPIP